MSSADQAIEPWRRGCPGLQRSPYIAAARHDIAGSALAPGEARAFVAKTVPGHPRLDDLALVVSELVTNAVRHSRSGRLGGLVSVVVVEGTDADGPYVGLEVIDDGGVDEFHRPAVPRDGAESGHGLFLVQAVCERWGSYTTASGRRTVWASVAIS